MQKINFTEAEYYKALSERYGEAVVARLKQSTVAICGLGGLGSNIASAAARAGIGKLILIDFDSVDLSNLHRQEYKASQVGMLKTEALAENIKEIAPFISIEKHNQKLTADNCGRILKAADLIFEAFDSAEAKAELINGIFEQLPEKIVVAASGMAGWGPANMIKSRKITEKFILCGDGESDAADGPGLLASRVKICAAHQAHAALRILTEDLRSD